MKKQCVKGAIAVSAFLFTVSIAFAAITPPPVTVPTSKDQCKHGGWQDFGSMFKNQGDCVSFVATGGKNAPDGSGL